MLFNRVFDSTINSVYRGKFMYYLIQFSPMFSFIINYIGLILYLYYNEFYEHHIVTFELHFGFTTFKQVLLGYLFYRLKFCTFQKICFLLDTVLCFWIIIYKSIEFYSGILLENSTTNFLTLIGVIMIFNIIQLIYND